MGSSIHKSHLDSSKGSEPSRSLKGKRSVMNRLLKLFAALMPISLICALHGNPQMNSAYEIHRQHAVQINELAGKIQSPGDSRMLVDMIAEMFADELPPALATRSIRDRVAHAEYELAIDPSR